MSLLFKSLLFKESGPYYAENIVCKHVLIIQGIRLYKHVLFIQGIRLFKYYSRNIILRCVHIYQLECPHSRTLVIE